MHRGRCSASTAHGVHLMNQLSRHVDAGDGASKATGTKKKKLKSPALVPAAAPMTGQSPLLEKIPKAEFDKQAVKLLGKAHKRRR